MAMELARSIASRPKCYWFNVRQHSYEISRYVLGILCSLSLRFLLKLLYA